MKNYCTMPRKEFYELMEMENRHVAKIIGENPDEYVESIVIRNSKWTKYYNKKYGKKLLAIVQDKH